MTSANTTIDLELTELTDAELARVTGGTPSGGATSKPKDPQPTQTLSIPFSTVVWTY